jgi:hypothetical protein
MAKLTYPDLDDDDEIDMRLFINRLRSFKHWPHSFLNPMLFASLGFYYSGKLVDLVRCTYCGITFRGWSEGDCPQREHDLYAPNCIKSKQRSASRN